MKKLQRQKGFTLVELAIVLTIIGLLIGGILKGQQLITNARITSTIAQVKAIEAATSTFRDTYAGLPGDMANANLRVPNCNTCGATTGTDAGIGDGFIGATGWDMRTPQVIVGRVVAVSTQTLPEETFAFWYQLAQAGLLSGITSEVMTAAVAPTFGGGLPQAKLAGGFLVGNANTAATPAGKPVASTMSGLAIMEVESPTAVIAAAPAVGASVMLPSVAGQMDRKMDDGLPGTGDVQGYGTAASCWTGAAPGYAYLENVQSNDCGVIFKIGA